MEPSAIANTPSFFRSLRNSPAITFFLLVWLFAAGFMWLYGFTDQVWFGLLDLLGVGLLSLLTLRITLAAPASSQPETRREWFQLWLQFGFILLVITLTGYRGAAFHHLVPTEPGIPLWTSLNQTLENLGGEWLGNDNFIANPVIYFLIPFLGLILLGARPVGLGFGHGHRVWLVTLLWSAVPILFLGVNLILGNLSFPIIWQRLISNALQNGFFEEFLFRGALQTRLRQLISPSWAVVLQAVIFGVWHLGLGWSNTGGIDLFAALSSTLLIQSVLGLAFGVIFERTRNLIAPSIVHVVFNSMGI